MGNCFDIIVIGAGHAGCEAAYAAAQLGSKCLLITMNMTDIAQMSCNPAMGGIAKGQIVREIDALGGMSAIITDHSTLQFRMLGTSKGTAMWSPRAQCDRSKFSQTWRTALETCQNLSLWQDEATQIIVHNHKAEGVETAMGVRLMAKAIILTAGTFLNGKLFVGNTQSSGGRSGSRAAHGITAHLHELGIESGRMKTGTSMRVDGRSIDFHALTMQKGDEQPFKFSFSPKTHAVQDQMPCYIAQTNAKCHAALRKGFADSPLFNGTIKGAGPRYCPSIEDKLLTFADKDSHHLFVEPDGRNTCEYYLNGFSSSLPYAVQIEALRCIAGFEHARVFRPGYAVEYDYFPPTQLHATLESKHVGGLYFAGQVNGTTGYEEAAGQGLCAGINAHAKVHGGAEFVLQRHEAYLGVLIDDLVTKGVDEPYRMFTSRAEHRILLRQDNADLRLLPIAMRHGLLPTERVQCAIQRQNILDSALTMLKEHNISPSEINACLLRCGTSPIEQPHRLWDILQRPQVSLCDLEHASGGAWHLPSMDAAMRIMVESAVKYYGYEQREREHCAKMERLSALRIPAGYDYGQIAALSTEAQHKLQRIQPATIAQAQRIPGVSPADIAALLVRFGR
jgi:tRNA uridine 5-carboxymethylaminomethyl modification enzyme